MNILGGSYVCKVCERAVINGQTCQHREFTSLPVRHITEPDFVPIEVKVRQASDVLAAEAMKMGLNENHPLKKAVEEYDFLTGRGNHHG